MNLRENGEAIYRREQPDYYFDLMDAMEFIVDPVFEQDALIPQDGKEYKDSWGTVKIFEPGAPGPQPWITEDNVVIPDIENWAKYLMVPDIESLDWSAAIHQSQEIDRTEKFACIFSPGGIFERTHFLMGFENALINYLEYPEEMKAILRKIADYKIAFINKAGKLLEPDVIFYHDDWGSKQNLLLPPRVWREMIKPLQKEIAQAIHDNGMIYMHHADCVCEPVVEDMVEIGVDIWQGVIPQNDIVRIQKITDGRLAMIGGIDGPKIDFESTTDEEIRREVRRAVNTYCPGGRFYPGIANGVCFNARNDKIEKEELRSYGRKFAESHPV